MRLFRRSPTGDGARWIVVGLGNPGARYARTRHNAGVMVIEILLERVGVALKRHKSGCLIAETEIAGTSVVLARPTSYMNESGRQVGPLVRWYKSPVDHVVVVHDELDLPLGEVRVKAGGGTAGHNGVKSLAGPLGGKDFVRVRVGVSRPRAGDATAYVLSDFSAGERHDLSAILERSADAVERIIEAGVERAMNEINTR